MPSLQELIAVAAAGLSSAVATPLGIFALCCGALAAVLGVISSFVKTMEDPVRADGPVSRDVAEWQSLTIEPIVSAIKSGHSLRLRAMAQDAEGLDLTEINHEVDWSSSDRTAITVDATGLATALPVSGGAVITAKLRGGSLEASLDLTVEFAPVLGPPVLKKIELSPASSQGMPHFAPLVRSQDAFRVMRTHP